MEANGVHSLKATKVQYKKTGQGSRYFPFLYARLLGRGFRFVLFCKLLLHGN